MGGGGTGWAIGGPTKLPEEAWALVAMIANFLLNNLITYRDRRLRGWRILEGLILFCIACSIGLLINLTVADNARNAGAVWYLAVRSATTYRKAPRAGRAPRHICDTG